MCARPAAVARQYICVYMLISISIYVHIYYNVKHERPEGLDSFSYAIFFNQSFNFQDLGNIILWISDKRNIWNNTHVNSQRWVTQLIFFWLQILTVHTYVNIYTFSVYSFTHISFECSNSINLFFFRTHNFNCTYICLHLDRNLLYQFLLFLVNRVVFPCVLFMTVYRFILFHVHVVLLYICFYHLDRNLLYQLWLYIGYLISYAFCFIVYMLFII